MTMTKSDVRSSIVPKCVLVRMLTEMLAEEAFAGPTDHPDPVGRATKVVLDRLTAFHALNCLEGARRRLDVRRLLGWGFRSWKAATEGRNVTNVPLERRTRARAAKVTARKSIKKPFRCA